ncbi:FAD binding domain-containing protein [Cucurbitaria berberidis CBS 394.84]|uniref:FAD binding domain-containing protein n=1 Tax=Cucurbitaria berberidis CBS 394.84 TaxID=1168544 RepID=A0A9P4L7L7_9PLEO|nr:FAD binding domain-containing protein [Cucurbitaria berberidis CBS 394.84]KAF1845105.1 FAD binding domain-containing protein [Cucurbitaria berberidis CBS 394.84]
MTITKNAVVVGGSLAGLMHGIMLRDNGYSVTILEQEPSTHRQGLDAGIRVGPDFIQFMKQYDRVKREYGIMATHAHVLDKNETIKFKVPWNAALTSWGLVWSILRANFDGQSSEAVPNPPPLPKDAPEARYRSGARVTDVQELNEVIRIQFEDILNGETQVVEADIVIAADGSMSSVRKIVCPSISCEYAGYVTWRGTVPEYYVDKEAHGILGKNLTIHRMHCSHFVIYVIPTDEGQITPGKRLINWVWYHELPAGSADLKETMTDIHGKVHQGTVPRELIRPEVWAKQKALGISKTPACIAQLLERTKSPFVTKIYENTSPRAVFMHGKLVLVGDALVKTRPHSALSTNQAAYDCLALESVLKGRASMNQWESKVLGYGHRLFLWSRILGNFQQGYKLALLWSIWKYVVGFVGLKLGLLPWRSKME